MVYDYFVMTAKSKAFLKPCLKDSDFTLNIKQRCFEVMYFDCQTIELFLLVVQFSLQIEFTTEYVTMSDCFKYGLTKVLATKN